VIPSSFLFSPDVASSYSLKANKEGKELLTITFCFYSLEGLICLYTSLDCDLVFILLKEIYPIYKLIPCFLEFCDRDTY